MAYLKLGNTHIRYGRENTVDRLILSQVVDSGCSYKNPKLIRSIEDLELFFGNSYEDYEYHKELLSNGATLYLYKPITDNYTSLKSGISGWIDFSNYVRFSYIDYSDNSYKFPTAGAEYYTEAEYDDSGNLVYYDINEILEKSEDKEEVLEKYRENKIFTSIEELPKNGLVSTQASTKFIFTVVEDGEPLDYYFDDLLEEYVCLSKLPQILDSSNYITGKFNRDTLRITTKSWINNLSNQDAEKYVTERDKDSNLDISYEKVSVPYSEVTHCNPRYSSRNYTPSYPDLPEISYEADQKKQLFESVTGKEKYLGGDIYSLAYTFDFSDVSKEDIKVGDYIVMSDPVNQSGSVFYFGGPEDLPTIGDNEVGGAQRFGIKIDPTTEDPIGLLMKTILEETKLDGEDKETRHSNWYLGYKENEYIYHIWNVNGVTPNSQFFSIPGLKITPDVVLTQDVLSVLTEDFWRIEFYSKTIGLGDENIKVKIEKLDTYNPERYRITISRYSYSEIFEGNLYIKEDLDGRIENLEYIINSGSKLVECKIRRKVQKREYLKYNKSKGILERSNDVIEVNLTSDDESDGLPEGEWYLSRAIKETYTSEDYFRSLNLMEKEIRIKEDFLLIPEIKPWGLNTYKEKIFDYTNSVNTQALIVNHNNEYTKNIITDLKGRPKDLENRLVFFLEDIQVNWNKRPGYYVFLRGILGQGYTLPLTGVQYPRIYKTINKETKGVEIKTLWPWEELSGEKYESTELIIENPYSDYSKILEKFKCNYLVFNNHNYYYRKLFSHQGDNNYKMTILSKYCQTHVTRVVEREFTQFLSYIYSGDMMDEMNNILRRIRSCNKIISDLYIEYIEMDTEGQSLDVHLHLDIREAADKDISLGVTLNFNLT